MTLAFLSVLAAGNASAQIVGEYNPLEHNETWQPITRITVLAREPETLQTYRDAFRARNHDEIANLLHGGHVIPLQPGEQLYLFECNPELNEICRVKVGGAEMFAHMADLGFSR